MHTKNIKFLDDFYFYQKVKPYKIIKIDQNITKVNQSQEHTSCSGENILLNFFTFFSEKYLHLMYVCSGFCEIFF